MWSHKKTGYISKLQSSYAFLLKARLLRNTLPQGTTIFPKTGATLSDACTRLFGTGCLEHLNIFSWDLRNSKWELNPWVQNHFTALRSLDQHIKCEARKSVRMYKNCTRPHEKHLSIRLNCRQLSQPSTLGKLSRWQVSGTPPSRKTFTASSSELGHMGMTS